MFLLSTSMILCLHFLRCATIGHHRVMTLSFLHQGSKWRIYAGRERNRMKSSLCFRSARNSPRIFSTQLVNTLKRTSTTTSLSQASKDDELYYMPPSLTSVQKDIQRKNMAAKTSSGSMPISNTQSESTIAKSNNQQQRQGSIFIDGLATSHLGLDPKQNTRHAPIIYHEHYSCPWPSKHTFPMSKFRETANSLLNDQDEFLMNNDETGTAVPAQLVLSQDDFYKPLSVETFPQSFMSPPICPNFLQKFLSGSLSSEECRLIGFREQTSRPELIRRTVLEVAGTVLTAQLAVKYGLACNVAGGTHHAQSDKGAGFTILNDLAVATRLLTWKGNNDDHDNSLLRAFYRGDGSSSIDRVLVVDCDVHQGDGTATFAYESSSLHNKLFTLDIHAENNYPHPKEVCSYDIGLPDDCGDEMYLSELSSSLEKALREVQPHLVLYNAGVDVYTSDKLGRLEVSWEGMKQRDLHVIRTCVDRKIPVAAVVGGGYDNDPHMLGKRHALVHRACAQVWREKKMWTR